MTQPGEPRFTGTFPSADPKGARQISSASGWTAFTHSLSHHVPRELRNAKNARKGVYRLIRAGR